MSSMAKYAKSRANRVVVAHSEDPLLNISATEAAKQIREGKVRITVKFVQYHYYYYTYLLFSA